MNVLITAATSAEAHRLKNQLVDDTVILGDYLEMPAFMQIVKLPNPASMSYAHEMLTLCLDRGIGIVYALGGDELNNLLEAEQLFTEYGIKVVHRR
ncbi:MAG: hypothetical protein ABJA76_21565 [Mucilaginibacter sp.]